MRRSKCDDCPRVKALQAEVAALRRKVEELSRAAKRQAAPFSKGEPKRNPKRPGRKSGAAYGRRAHRASPRHVDEEHDALLPGSCPHCLGRGTLVEEGVADQYQTDIPPVRPITRRFRVHVGHCSRCGRRVQGRHPLQTSDALGAANVQIGPAALALGAEMNKGLGVPYGKIAAFFATAFSLVVSRATWCRANMRLAGKARPTYDAMVLAVRGSVVVYSDETGWKIAGELAWLWVFVTAEITVIVIRRSRGFDVIEEVLGSEFGGILGRDGWAAYRKLAAAAHQSCTRHLVRRADELHEIARAGEARFPLAVGRVLRAGLALRDRREEMSPRGFAVARGLLEARMDRVLSGRIEYEPNARFRRHLSKERDAIFTYLYHPWIEATTWMAEQEIRPGVVNRKTSGGSRSDGGSEAQAILPSVLRTARRQGREPVGMLVRLMRSPVPIDLGLARGRPGRARIIPLPRGQPLAMGA